MSEDILPEDNEYYIDDNSESYRYCFGAHGSECPTRNILISKNILRLHGIADVTEVDPDGAEDPCIEVTVRHMIHNQYDPHTWHYHPDELRKLSYEEACSMYVLSSLS